MDPLTYLLFGAAATLLAAGTCFVTGAFIRLHHGMTPRDPLLDAVRAKPLLAGLALLAISIVLNAIPLRGSLCSPSETSVLDGHQRPEAGSTEVD